MLVAVRIAALLLAANPNPPTVITPAEDALVCSTDVSFSGNADPPSLSTNTVNISVGGLTASASVASGGTWSTQLTVPDGGNYTANVTETVADAIGGGTGTSAPTIVNFRVELGIDPPVLSQPATNGQVYVTANPLIAGSAQPNSQVTFVLADSLLDDAGAEVIVLDGGTFSGPLATGASGNGTYALHTWVDSNDACAVTSDQAVRAMTIDTTPATLDSLDAGAVLNTSTVTLAGTGVPTTQVIVTVNDAGSRVDVSDAGRWSMPAATLPEGRDSLTVQDVDLTGGESAPTTIGVTVFLTHITSPANDAHVGANVTFSGSAAPGTSVSLSVTADGGPVPSSANVSDDGGWSCSLTLDPGTHTATAVDFDGAFSGSSDVVSFTVVATTTTTTASSSSGSTSSTNGSGSTSGSTGETTTTGTTGTTSSGSSSAGTTTSSGSVSAGSGSGSSGTSDANPSLYRACGCASDDGPAGLFALLLVAGIALGRRRP